MIPFVLLVFLVATVLVKYFLHMRRMERYVKNLHCMGRVWPFIGNAHMLMGKSSLQLFKDVTKYTLEAGTPYKSYVGPMLFIVLDKPEDMKTILTSSVCIDKPYPYDYLPSRNSLLTARTASAWKPVRKIMNPAFSLKVLQSWMPVFNDETKTMLTSLDAELGKSAFDVFPHMNICTLGTICATTMGVNSMSRNDIQQFLESLEIVFETMIKRFIYVWPQLDFVYRFTQLYQLEQKHMSILHNFTDRVFEVKKSEYLVKKQNPQLVDYEKAPQSSIDVLLESYFSGRASEQLIKQQIEVLLMAGGDTTALTISFALLMLAMHPDMQEKLYSELHSVYNSQDEETTFDMLHKLPLLECCLKETLRMFPAASLIGRVPAEDIAVSTCVIPKDTIVALSIVTLHRRKDVWGEDVDEFNPERFLPENSKNRHAFSFLPFSGGPRNCIGNQQSMLLMKVILSACIRNYKFTTTLKMSELEFKYYVTLQVIQRHMVSIEKRIW